MCPIIINPKMDFTDKVALITGGSKGIGQAYCKALLQRGARVSLLDVNDEVGQKTAEEFQKEFGSQNAIFVKCDVTKQSDLEEAFQKTKDTFGSLDIVCNNAGILDETNWEKMLDVNLNGVIRGTQLGIRHMHPDNGGRGGVIVNVSSEAGLGPAQGIPVYCGAKWAVIGYTRSIAETPSVTDVGIRCNIICPSFVQTDIIESLVPYLPETFLPVFRKVIPHSPEYVAKCFIELLEDPSRNGAVLYLELNKEPRYITMTDMRPNTPSK